VLVMPANSTGWFWHCLARETGRIGHLYSPGAQRGPWPWFPFALDNGAFSCWDMQTNRFDDDKWKATEVQWRSLIRWAAPMGLARWSIVPDVPGDSARTLERYSQYARSVADCEINPAIAVQDGMTPDDIRKLSPSPVVVCVGGTTDWKWKTVEMWAESFSRVHVLRCNSPTKLEYLEGIGIESCDGTGWNRGDSKQTQGVEDWARRNASPKQYALSPYVCRAPRKNQPELFAF
jgi:hypothetical protein